LRKLSIIFDDSDNLIPDDIRSGIQETACNDVHKTQEDTGSSFDILNLDISKFAITLRPEKNKVYLESCLSFSNLTSPTGLSQAGLSATGLSQAGLSQAGLSQAGLSPGKAPEPEIQIAAPPIELSEPEAQLAAPPVELPRPEAQLAAPPIVIPLPEALPVAPPEELPETEAFPVAPPEELPEIESLPVGPPEEPPEMVALPVAPPKELPETEAQPAEVSHIDEPSTVVLPVEFSPVEVLPVTHEIFEVKPVESTVPPRSFTMPPDIGRRFRSRREEKERNSEEPQHSRKKEKKVRQRPLRQAAVRLKNTHRVLFRILISVVAVSVALIVLFQLFTPGVVSDQAMEDTLKQNESIVISKVAYWFDQPQYGDIVVYTTPAYSGDGSKNPTVGRIIGLPGDRISIWDGSVYRNDIKLDEPYVKGGMTSTRLNEIVVLEGTYFILGDNRDASRDSRHRDVGLISKNQIIGKVIVPKVT